ncbi:MAG: T9SS type A sorting domain-containing protein [Bacteroidales bacterium]|nr:T9SS type A sorting domain-containing protein [Bacteroidales bacterium]
MTFVDEHLKPNWISIYISIETVPTWTLWAPSPNGKLARLYKIASSENSSSSQAIINMRYLASEIASAPYNDESKLVFWHKFASHASGAPHEHGKSEQNFTNHSLQVTGIILGSSSTENLDDSQVAIAYSLTTENTWKGEVVGHETEWEQTQNWTEGHIPLSTEAVLIPSGLTYYPSLTSSANAVAGIIKIEEGASITLNSYTLTVSGAGGAWDNHGTLYSGTGTVVFNHGVSTEIVTVAGITNFYNIQVAANTTIQPVSGSTFRIAGAATATATSKANWSLINSTVEWNGVDQNILNPQGFGGVSTGFYNLILSGSGTKTMPNSALTVHGDFTISGTATALAQDSIYIVGNTSIENGATFNIGSKSHLLNGTFENDGTLTAATGGNVIFNGTSEQSISGSSTTDFNILTIDNTNGVAQSSSVNVTNNLSLINGDLIVGNTNLGLNGTITSPGGQIQVGISSNISFGGTVAITLNDNLFSENPSLNDMTINRSGGVTFANQGITVNGTLYLSSGTLTIGENALTIAGNSPVRTSGNIDASNSAAEILFDNSVAITIPASSFTGNVNNLTLNGVGGVTNSDDISINGILSLQAANPSSSTGILDMSTHTLDMGIDATTIGVGDVTGIVRRQHTFTDNMEYSFGNQFTTLNFLGVSGSTKPSWISCKIELGTAPVWRSTNVNRIYSFAQAAGGSDRVYTRLHYLDSELDGSELDKEQITLWNDYDGVVEGENTFVVGRTTYNVSDNWVELLGMAIDFIAPSATFAKEYSLGYSDVTTITWTGLGSASYPGDWSLPGHWSGGVPTACDDVLIPASLPVDNSGYPDNHLLINIQAAEVKNLKIEEGASLDASNFDLTVYGNGDAWVNNGTFTPGEKTVYFSNGLLSEEMNISGSTQFYNLYITDKTNIVPQTNCAISISKDLTCDGIISNTNVNTINFNSSESSQNLSGIGQVNINNLTMANTFASGVLNLLMPISISNALTLTNNNIICDDVNYIEMGSTSSVSPAEGRASSYIDGPMFKVGNTAFVFPIGSGNTWAPIGIEAPANASSISAIYNLSNGPYNWSTAYMCSGSEMLYASGVENWELTTTDSYPGVTLYWKSADSDIVEPADIIVAHYNGTCWKNMGGTADGDASSGSISSTVTFTSYNPITFATKSKDNPLPVSLLNFEANCNGNYSELSWTTASETNNNMFEIEFSTNAQDWTQIGTVYGNGNTNSISNYNFDYLPENNFPAYYRLVQIDFDGKRTELAMNSTDCSTATDSKITIMPNPANEYVKIVSNTELTNEPYTLTNTMGQQVIKGIANGYETEIKLENLNPGVYYLLLPGKKDSFKLSKF